jgi:hypothetical protein
LYIGIGSSTYTHTHTHTQINRKIFYQVFFIVYTHKVKLKRIFVGFVNISFFALLSVILKSAIFCAALHFLFDEKTYNNYYANFCPRQLGTHRDMLS